MSADLGIAEVSLFEPERQFGYRVTLEVELAAPSMGHATNRAAQLAELSGGAVRVVGVAPLGGAR